MEPINTRNPSQAARAYTVLEWPVALGHRYRPRQGCTCGDGNCPTPGAHPLAGPLPPLDGDDLDEALQAAPGAAIIASAERFDVLIVPRRVGMATMASLDRLAPISCLIYGHTAGLFVLPATGRYAAVDDPRVEVRSGRDEWVALPPSHGVLWDTSPWIDPTDRPRALLHGGDVGLHLAQVLRLCDNPASRALHGTEEAYR